MAFQKVVVVGGGVLGSQIAYQVAYKAKALGTMVEELVTTTVFSGSRGAIC